MKYKKKSDNHEEISYWQSMTDLMSALMLIILLIFALVLLYIVRIPDVDYTDLYEGDQIGEEYSDPDDGRYDDWNEDNDHEDDGRYDETEREQNSGSGGGGHTETEHQYDYEYEYEYPGIEEGFGKAAVHVTVIDGETEKTILKNGVEFQLFRPGDILQVLNTYYPVRVEYARFETTDNGVFYLPEKIPAGDYYFHQLTAPEGYDVSENVGFHVVDSLDWPEPLEVVIPLYPSRNKILVQMTDKETKASVNGAEFDIAAAEDISTLDGTIHFTKGQIVDHIICDNNGSGMSSELYLGKYELVETVVPSYYARQKENVTVDLKKKTTSADADIAGTQHNIPAEKTSVTCQVFDELDQISPVTDAGFTAELRGNSRTRREYVTDAKGRFTITDLDKNGTYSVKQINTVDGYRILEKEFSFTVSEDGTVNDAVKANYDMYNRMIQVQIGIKDRIVGNLVSDYSTALYDSRDVLVDRWDSTGVSHVLKGVEPGFYKLILGSNNAHPFQIEVKDTCELQSFSVRIWTAFSMIVVLGIGILMMLLVVLFIRTRRKKKG